ncbi:hypothetical protein QBC46DRAFT_83878 [Diplogelasinospora grovesii]|uniref:Uncharacterized protein n=1 Tax=Diplogelasinospora grovesii TaxID=303347 RepID=A0AAN6NA56_9PEZI|nr:hypothetical protein QBC46DRAFT_83878 [Diplogelasinospora grovesii]
MVAWLEPILRYLAEKTTETTVVEIDVNDLETSVLVQRCFRSGYKKAQTVIRDRIFMRGEFSWESGYWDDDPFGCEQ